MSVCFGGQLDLKQVNALPCARALALARCLGGRVRSRRATAQAGDLACVRRPHGRHTSGQRARARTAGAVGEPPGWPWWEEKGRREPGTEERRGGERKEGREAGRSASWHSGDGPARSATYLSAIDSSSTHRQLRPPTRVPSPIAHPAAAHKGTHGPRHGDRRGSPTAAAARQRQLAQRRRTSAVCDIPERGR